MEFKDILKELRIEKDLKQRDLAEKINVTQAVISFLETGAREPTVQMLKNIAKYFNVSIDYLVGLEDEYGNKI
ncbi:MAG: helix-turn-helix domain-containing protein [Clostridiales bacterium]|jgi:transcriptional regulator with XRE-family HTH domain|nr:helix-turn-helix domain-containing protein [Clostridiales bacterium]